MTELLSALFSSAETYLQFKGRNRFLEGKAFEGVQRENHVIPLEMEFSKRGALETEKVPTVEAHTCRTG